MSIKTNDKVLIITGKDKGKQGNVLEIKGSRIKVHNVNLKVHHQKARKAQEKSAIRHLEGYIDRSNVMLLCTACNKPCRINALENQEKSGRSCNRCHASL